jgi:cyclophilin family peptidyl-prolyl cis-trans isomerase
MLVAMLTFALLLQAAANSPAIVPKSPGEIVAQAPAADWVDIKADDLLVMQLASGRRVVIQLMPPPFSQPWVANIRTLAKARWYDGVTVNRVQDNYVVQWGDATEKKALPPGMRKTLENEYTAKLPEALVRSWAVRVAQQVEASTRDGRPMPFFSDKDAYAPAVSLVTGVPIGMKEDGEAWPVHCYGMVGVGRNLSPDAGNGTELYTVIGHAPRHLDRNIALVGRVVEGIEHLSSLPRGTGNLGFYEDTKQRVPIASIRLASDLPEAERPRLQFLSTESATFAVYADARANRKDAFFNVPAGGADICNVPVPVRKKP